MPFIYNIEEHPLLRTAFRWAHTIWPLVLENPCFWLFLIFHVFAWCCFRYELLEPLGIEMNKGLLSINWKDIGIVSTITTFFEVFYTTQSYGRYVDINQAVNQSFRCSHRFCYELKQHTRWIKPRESGRQYLRLAMRYLQVQVVVFFMDLRSGPPTREKWSEMIASGLVTADEVNFLCNYTVPQISIVLMDWVCQIAVEGASTSRLSSKGNAKGLIDRILLLDEAQKRILDLVRMPVPFQYYHILNVMIVINIFLWSYGVAMTCSLFGPFTVFSALFIFLGMLELAKLFSDPFGDDEVDFPIHIWVEKFLEDQIVYLESDLLPGGFDGKVASESGLRWKPGQVASIINVGEHFFRPDAEIEEDNSLTALLCGPPESAENRPTDQTSVDAPDRGAQASQPGAECREASPIIYDGPKRGIKSSPLG